MTGEPEAGADNTPGGVSILPRLSKAAFDALDTLSRRTRVRKGDYFREAIEDLLAKYAAQPGLTGPSNPWTAGNITTHFVAKPVLHQRLQELAQRLRISMAALLHEALADVLAKHITGWRSFTPPASAETQRTRCEKPGCNGTAFAADTHITSGELWLTCIACNTPVGPFGPERKEATP